jgi:hypothetical protein
MATQDIRVALSFHQGGVTNRATVRTEDVSTEVDAKMLHISKSLFDSEELRNVRHLNNEVRSWVRGHSVPSYLRSGIYLVKLKHTEEVKTYLAAKLPDLHAVVGLFVDVLPKAQQDAKERLGKHYSEADYPTAAAVRAAFVWNWEWLSLEAPTELQKVSLQFYKEAEARAAKQMKAIMADIEQGLFARTLELLDSTLETLKPDADGKVKGFRAPVITKIEKFLELLPYQDTGNQDLAGVASKMRAAINGLDPAVIREGGDFATALAGRFDQMKVQIAKLVNKPRRALDLDDGSAA